MLPALVAVPLAVAVVVAYMVLRTAAARSRRVRAAPPTPELRDEPPAVVNLLVNQLTDAPQVASATLLDLAARRVVEIHEVSDGAEHTLVRLRDARLSADSPEYEPPIVERRLGPPRHPDALLRRRGRRVHGRAAPMDRQPGLSGPFRKFVGGSWRVGSGLFVAVDAGE